MIHIIDEFYRKSTLSYNSVEEIVNCNAEIVNWNNEDRNMEIGFFCIDATRFFVTDHPWQKEIIMARAMEKTV